MPYIQADEVCISSNPSGDALEGIAGLAKGFAARFVKWTRAGI
jgi:hypothetical protein